jgi:hypothetical protein
MFKRNTVVLSSLHTNSLINPDMYCDGNGNKLTKKTCRGIHRFKNKQSSDKLGFAVHRLEFFYFKNATLN